jgi:uncharacterized protein (TIGR03083 family)
MTSSADNAVTALRSGHDDLVNHVESLTPEQVTGPSGASQWSIADVLSHLGSGAEIGLAALESSLGAEPAPADGFNQSVWDRWNANSPQDQAADFVVANEALVARYEGLDDDTRSTGKVDLGFLPAPVDVATAAGFRLNEFALHSWDVRVPADPAATVAPEAVGAVLDVAPHLFGWLGKPGSVLDGRTEWLDVTITDPDRRFGLKISDTAALTDVPDAPTGSLTLPAESWLRLFTGRLAAAHTPGTAAATGSVTLEQLRQIFPGF